MLAVSVTLVLIELPPKAVESPDTILPVVLSALAPVTRDKTRLCRFAEHIEQIKHMRSRSYERCH